MLPISSMLARLRMKPQGQHSAWETFVLSFNRGVVTVYKLAGFVLLTVILLGMFAYLSMSGFYLVSNRWAVPSILTPNNDKVVQAQLGWLSQRRELDQLEAELTGYQYDLSVAQLAGSTWREYGDAFESALSGETKLSKAKLAAVQNIMKAINTSATGAQATMTPEELDRQLAKGLIDIEEFARLKAMSSRASLDQAEQRERALTLREKAASLRSLSATGSATDVEALLRRRPLIESKLEGANQQAREAALTARIATLATLIDSFRLTVDHMRENPYVRAGEAELQVAFVPYSNLNMATEGAPVWDCLLSFVLCRKVGTVTGIVGGEVVGNHPITGRDLRGRMVEMHLEHPEHAEARSLILARPPFFF